MKHLGWGILGGVLALWLFLTVFDIQHRDYTEQKAVQERDKAVFDRDFQKALGGSADADAQKRVQLAQADVEKIRVEHEQREKQLEKEREQMRTRAGDALLVTPGVPGLPPAPPAADSTKPQQGDSHAH